MKTVAGRLRVAIVGLFLFALLSAAGVAMQRIWATPYYVMFTIDTTYGSPGEEVEVTVSLTGNPGIAGFFLHMYFNGWSLTPTYVTKNPYLGGEVFISNTDDPFSLTAVWGSSANSHVEELFTIRFRISDNAHFYSHYISLYVTDLINEDREDIYAHTSQGVINVVPPVNWGNVTGTGYLHIGDLIRIAQHIAEFSGMELYGEAFYLADVDRDGRITVSDLVLIAQYLANPGSVRLGVEQ